MSTAKIHVTSVAFEEGEPIPVEHTCRGDDASPPLHWEELPDGTQSIAVICEDPDAPNGTWAHWVIFNLPPHLSGLPPRFPPVDTLPNGAVQGKNDFKRIGYGGPCPPPGAPHRYFFKVYALDAEMPRKLNTTRPELLAAMKGHILGEGHLMGTFQRR